MNPIIERYKKAAFALKFYKDSMFQLDAKVIVDCPQYKGPGVVTTDDGCPLDKVAVKLENGNVWWYPIEACKIT